MATLTKEQVRQIIANAPPGTSPEGIVAALRETHQLEGYDAPLPNAFDPDPTHGSGVNYGDRALAALPAIGGAGGAVVGGALAGPAGAFYGAAGGGMLGEGLRQAAKGESFDPNRLAARGGEQAAWEATGMGLQAAAQGVARPLYSKALGNVTAFAKRFKTTPEAITETGLASRYPVSLEGDRMAQAVGRSITAGRNAKLAATSGTVGAETLSQRAIAAAENNLKRPLNKYEKKILIEKVQAEADRILTEGTFGVAQKTAKGVPPQPASKILGPTGQPAIPAKPGIKPKPSRYSATELEQIKEVSTSESRAALKAEAEARNLAADPKLLRQMGSDARTKLNKIPGVRKDNLALKNNMAIQQSISKATTEPDDWSHLGVGPVAFGFKVPKKRLGDAALGLTSKKFQAFLSGQTGRIAAEFIHQAGLSQDVTQ